MKRKFFKVSFLTLLMASMSATFVGCKDYDSEIDNLTQTTDDLSKQISALEAAVQTNKDAAAAAASAAQQAIADAKAAAEKGDQALAQAQAAAAQAELAKQAAAQAKADAISEVLKELKPLVDANAAGVKENAEAIAKLIGRLDGIEAGLANIKIEDINASIGENARAIAQLASKQEAAQVQIDALLTFKTNAETQLSDLASKVNGLSSDLSTLSTKVDGLVSDLTALTTRVSTLEADVNANKTSIGQINSAISGINTELSNLSTKITTEVNAALSTIAGTMANRLTSLTLIPDLYIGGIPTIEFVSAKYYVQKQDTKGDWVNDATKEFIVSNNETTAEYRVNPNTISDGDIVKTGMKYVSRIATARSAEKENDIVNVADASISGGIMTVKLGKSNTKSLNLAGDQIYTVSLKVPVDKKHLFEGEGEFSVFSEFTRLSEAYLLPQLCFTDHVVPSKSDDVNKHLDRWSVISASAMNKMVAYKLVYNKTLDLSTIVTGCLSDANTDETLTAEQLKAYGFEVQFAVADGKYVTTPDGTDQQKFAKIDGSVLTPVLPDGTAFNQNVIGKQPIIQATLYDTINKNIVARKYFKVLYVAADMVPVEKTFPDNLWEQGKLGCAAVTKNITWDNMIQYVLKSYDADGISKEDFAKIYKVESTSSVRTDKNTTFGEVTVDINADNTGASTPVVKWNLPVNELTNIKAGDVIGFKGTVKFVDPAGLHPDVIITFTWSVKVPDAPVLGKAEGYFWKDEVLTIIPKQMPVPYDGSTATYDTNILQDRLKPYVTGLLGCDLWDVDYAPTAYYVGEALAFQKGYGHWVMDLDNQNGLTTIGYQIKHDETGIALVQKAFNAGHFDVTLDWAYRLLGLSSNEAIFGHSTLRIARFLELTTKENKGIVDDNQDVMINLNNLYSIKDYYGHDVIKDNNYWKYYVVQEPEYAANGPITVASTPDGKGEPLAKYNMVANVKPQSGELVYRNEGAPLMKDAYLQVPVQVKHKWGVLTTTMVIKVAHVK